MPLLVEDGSDKRDNHEQQKQQPIGRIKFELFREMLGMVVNPFSIKGECSS